jgi:hypothetical protein
MKKRACRCMQRSAIIWQSSFVRWRTGSRTRLFEDRSDTSAIEMSVPQRAGETSVRCLNPPVANRVGSRVGSKILGACNETFLDITEKAK